MKYIYAVMSRYWPSAGLQ